MNYKDRFIVLDIETTGLNYEYFDEPTEIALVEIENGIKKAEKHYYLKPKKKYTIEFLEKIFGKEVLKETKKKKLADARDFLENQEQTEEIKNLLNKTLEAENYAKEMHTKVMNGGNKFNILPEVRNFIGDSIVVAHNASFDVNFLNYYFVSMNLPTMDKYICTFKSFKEHFGFKKNNLEVCCDYYGITLKGAHNALADTIACADLFLKEINDFPDDMLFFDLTKFESYANFKKRVLKTKYLDFTKKIVEETSYANENIKVEDELAEKCYKMFFNFKKPLQVSKSLDIDLYTTESLFLKWVNMMNINKHLDLIKDRNLSTFVKEVISFCNRDFNDIRTLHLLLFDSEPNYFIYRLFDKLEYRKMEMNYEPNSFNYYFDNLYDLEELNKKIGKGYDYLIDELFVWLNSNNDRIDKYKILLNDLNSKNTKLGKSVQRKLKNISDKSLYLD